MAAADADGVNRVSERLAIRTRAGRLPVKELQDHHGGWLHVVGVPVSLGGSSGAVGWQDDEEVPTDLAAGFSTEPPAPGIIRIDFACTVEGTEVRPLGGEADLIRYVRPSRYAESDKLFPIATGADASDTAFLSTVRGGLFLDRISVDAAVAD